MCGRYTLVTELKVIEERFGAAAPEGAVLPANPNISPGELTPVITSEAPGQLQLYKFGLIPSWAQKPMLLINARAEGDGNPNDDPHYSGGMGIIQKPAYRMPIRAQRCLVLADAFIEGPRKEKLDQPWLIYPRHGRAPFAMAGIWDSYVNPHTGQQSFGFAIITSSANPLLQAIGHHRSPVILPPAAERDWLNPDLPLAEVTALLRTFDADDFNAYPIHPAVKNPKEKSLAVLQPQGPLLYPEYSFVLSQELKLEGMGMTTSRKRKQQEGGDTNQLSLF